jgi:lipoprotein-anchoring transpeptidase ErfK/SrfK
MQRLIVPALLTSLFTITGAAAGPLNLQPDSDTDQSLTRYAAADGPNYGGGFIEMLFRGPGAQQSAPRYEQQPGYYRPAEPAFGGRDQIEPTRYSAEPARPGMDPRYLKQAVHYDGREAPGTVIINTTERHLYLVQGDGTALRYGIGVGRPGFTWAGTHHVSQKREWPDWTPPPEMLKRRPELPRHMAGGPENPLGARAMYLGSSLYRIHGSNEPWTIGTAVSSGCIRMRNEDVIDLYEKIKVGTKVMVI